MKQKFLLFSVGITLCLLATVNFAMNTQSDRVSNLTLATAEATASEEGGGDGEESPYKWRRGICILNGKEVEMCDTYGDGNSCSTLGEVTRNC